MKVPILTAVADPRWESGIVSALDRGSHGVVVVRRCVDLADLLATAAHGTARAVLLSADLRRLDRDALARLALAGLAVVGLVPPGDEDAERRLRQLGVRWALAADAAADVVAATVAEAVAARQATGDPVSGYGSPLTALPAEPEPVPPTAGPVLPGTGRVVAVWGPAGAPGRTTVAVNLAAELAALDRDVLLIDADVYGGAVAQLLGMLEEAPGLAAACRLANTGTLDVPALSALCRQVVAPRLRVLTGITRAERWPEIRPAALEVVLALARSLADIVVVDCGFCLEQDEELSYDTAAPRRNGATITALQQADRVLAVVAADPVGTARGIRGIAELRETVPGLEPDVVLTKVRKGAVGGDPAAEVNATLRRYAGVEAIALVGYDRAALDAATLAGRTLSEVAPSSRVRADVAHLAAVVAGVPVARTRRRGRSGRSSSSARTRRSA